MSKEETITATKTRIEVDKKYVLILGDKVVATDDVDLAREFLGIGKATVTVDLRAEPAVASTLTAKEEKKPKPKKPVPTPAKKAAADISATFKITPNEHGGYHVKSGKIDTSVSGGIVDLTEESVGEAYVLKNKPVTPKEIKTAMETSFHRKTTASTITLALIVLRESNRVKYFRVGKRGYVYLPSGTRAETKGKEVPVVDTTAAKREEEVNTSVKTEKRETMKSLDQQR